MKYVLVTVALVFSTSAFGAVDASPPTELPGCELVGTVKNMGGWVWANRSKWSAGRQ